MSARTTRGETASAVVAARARGASGRSAGDTDGRAPGASRQGLIVASAVFVVLGLLFSGYFFRSLRAALQGEDALALRALSPQVLDRPATDLVFEDEKGAKVPLSAFKGKRLFVNFWATWCGPCREEMPSIEAMIDEIESSGMVVLLVSTDDSWDDVRRFYGGKPSRGIVLRDPGAAGAHAWGTLKYPETYLIDPTFKVKHRFIGPRNWASRFALRYLESFE